MTFVSSVVRKRGATLYFLRNSCNKWFTAFCKNVRAANGLLRKREGDRNINNPLEHFPEMQTYILSVSQAFIR